MRYSSVPRNTNQTARPHNVMHSTHNSSSTDIYCCMVHAILTTAVRDGPSHPHSNSFDSESEKNSILDTILTVLFSPCAKSGKLSNV